MSAARDLYLDLMMRCLTDWLYDDFAEPVRAEGLDWPARAHTMIGLRRLENLRACVEEVLARGVPGDLIETGAWRGGATIFMRAVLKAHGVTDRRVWVADSFAGLPPPDPERYPRDAGDTLHQHQQLAVSLDQVRGHFARYGLLDDQVRFLPGWFRDTLPDAPIERLAVLRLDGDLYESTLQALESLYDKLSPGGFVIVDDYGCIAACRQAVHDFRDARGVREPIRPVDWSGVYWQKARPVPPSARSGPVEVAERSGTPLRSRADFGELLNRLGLTGTGAEVGVENGFFARRVLDQWRGRLVYLVDVWQPMDDYWDVTNAPEREQVLRLHRTVENVAPHWGRVRIVQERSENAARLVPDAALDWVYLDANHEYGHVLRDLELWAPKVRPGGLIAGHDFLDEERHILGVRTVYGVKRAVHEFFPGRRVETTDEEFPTWFVTNDAR